MKSFLALVIVMSLVGAAGAQAKEQPPKHVILPNIGLVRCMVSDCYQLLQTDPPGPGDIYPSHVDVAFLDRWCPFGLTARYDKAVAFDDLRAALEKRYGKGTSQTWPDGPVVFWEIESIHVSILLDVADKRMAKSQSVEEGTKSIHYHDNSNKICPVR
jgi:hypothetical protein